MEDLNYVTFDKDGFTIRIYTGYNPIEGWSKLIRALIWFLGNENPEFKSPDNYRFKVCELLSALLPTWQVMQKMNG